MYVYFLTGEHNSKQYICKLCTYVTLPTTRIFMHARYTCIWGRMEREKRNEWWGEKGRWGWIRIALTLQRILCSLLAFWLACSHARLIPVLRVYVYYVHTRGSFTRERAFRGVRIMALWNVYHKSRHIVVQRSRCFTRSPIADVYLYVMHPSVYLCTNTRQVHVCTALVPWNTANDRERRRAEGASPKVVRVRSVHRYSVGRSGWRRHEKEQEQKEKEEEERWRNRDE